MTTENSYDQNNMPDAAPESLSGTVTGVAVDLKTAAMDKFDAAVTDVKSQADDAKASVANEVSDVATALRKASQDMRHGSAQERTLGQIANGLADASDALRDKDLGEIVEAISKVARQNPMLFLGGAAMLGFAVSRFAKASSTRMADTGQTGDYGPYKMPTQSGFAGSGIAS